MNVTAEQMGAVIRDHRKNKNLTQQDLAQAVGVSVQAVSKWEIGQSLPDVTLLPDIADSLGLTLDALFGRAEEAAPEARPVERTFPDDGTLRVAQFLGNRLLRADEQRQDTPPIPLAIEEALKNGFAADQLERLDLRVEIHNSARIEGDVRGDVSAGTKVECTGDINGDANAGAKVECTGDINGSASAGTKLECCGNINGSASAGTSLVCSGSIGGNAESSGSLRCGGNIGGSARAGGSLTCEGRVEGSARIIPDEPTETAGDGAADDQTNGTPDGPA